MKKNLFIDEDIPDNLAAALFNDKLYGFDNIEHFDTWSVFNPYAKDTLKALAFKMELKTYFGLSEY